VTLGNINYFHDQTKKGQEDHRIKKTVNNELANSIHKLRIGSSKALLEGILSETKRNLLDEEAPIPLMEKFSQLSSKNS
jgi:5'-3' exonuclease